MAEKMSAKERMAARAGKAKVEAPKGAAKKPRVEMVLTDAQKAQVDRLAAFTEIAKEADGLCETTDSVIRPDLRKMLLREWLKSGRPTENPHVNGFHSSFNFLAADNSSRFKVPAKDDGTMRTLEEYLNEKGFPKEFIALIVANDLKQREVQNITSPDDIETKLNKPELAEKIRDAILNVLENEDDATYQAVVKPNLEVKLEKTLTQNLPGYVQKCCKDEKDQLALLEKWIDLTKTVQFKVAQVRAHNLEEALREVSKKIAGQEGGDEDTEGGMPPVKPAAAPTKSETVKEHFTEDKAYKLAVEGFNVTLYRHNPAHNSSERIGVKKCKDARHTENTVKKFLRDREALEEFEKECEG